MMQSARSAHYDLATLSIMLRYQSLLVGSSFRSIYGTRCSGITPILTFLIRYEISVHASAVHNCAQEILQPDPHQWRDRAPVLQDHGSNNDFAFGHIMRVTRLEISSPYLLHKLQPPDVYVYAGSCK
jgi:hypothetical protein